MSSGKSDSEDDDELRPSFPVIKVSMELFEEESQENTRTFLCPPVDFAKLKPRPIAKLVSNALGDQKKHVGLVVLDIPYGVTGEHWDKRAWDGEDVVKLLTWAGKFINTFEPSSQNYNLLVFCSWQ